MEDSNIERWLPINIEDNTDKYWVSTLGRVYNKVSSSFVSPVLTGKPSYFYVNLKLSDNRKLRRVHNLMGHTFLDNPDNLKCVDHEDQNRYNNSLYNLRWASRKVNSNNMKSNVYIKDMKVEDYVKTLTNDLDVIKSSVIKIYKDKAYTEEGAKGVVYYFSNKEEIVKERKKKNFIKNLSKKKFTHSVEFNNIWFPSLNSLCDYFDVNKNRFIKNCEKDLDSNTIIEMSKNKWGQRKVYLYKGVVGDIQHLIDTFNPPLSVNTFYDRLCNKQWSFEDSLLTKVKSVRFYYYKREKYKMKDLVRLLGLNINQVRKKVSGYNYSLKDYCRDRGIPEWIHIQLP